MNRKRLMMWMLAAVIVMTAVLMPLHAGLGFGDFDSGSDWGGSDSDWGGSDWSSSDWGDSSSYRSSRGRSGDGSGAVILMLLVFSAMILIPIGINSSMKNESRNRARNTAAVRSEAADEAGRKKRLEELRNSDPNFDEAALIAWCKKLFTEMQESWEQGDITPVQYGFLPDTWNRFNTQLQMKNGRGETTHVRDISFFRVEITDYTHNTTSENLTVSIVADYNVWVTNKDGRNIQGTPRTRHRMTYRWTLKRPYGSASPDAKQADPMRCPNCGAELDLSAFAECPFCKAQISRKEHEWLLADITALSQRTIS